MKRASNQHWVVDETAYIDLATPKHPGAVAVIDAADIPSVIDGNGRWQPFYNTTARRLYVVRRTGPARTRKAVFLHRHLLGLSPGDGLIGDHINRVGLDNRRCNIRVATPAQNSANARHGRGASRFKGVSTHHAGRWRAEIRAFGASMHLGIFDSEEEAARAYDEAALDAHGVFALTNFGGPCVVRI